MTGVGIGVGVIALVCASIILAFWFAGLISRVLGKVGMVIIVRVLGLILCAMAVQFILTGLGASTVGVVRHDTAAPYQGTTKPLKFPLPQGATGH